MLEIPGILYLITDITKAIKSVRRAGYIKRTGGREMHKKLGEKPGVRRIFEIP
jgi:hypothetical protein